MDKSKKTTQEVINVMKKDESPVNAFYYMLAKRTMIISIIIAICSFIFFLFHHANIFLAVLSAFGMYVLSVILILILSLATLKIIALNKKKE